VIRFFNAAGCHLFSIPKDASLRTTTALESERHYVKDRSVLSLKDKFPNPIDIEGLHSFVKNNFKTASLRECMNHFGIQSSKKEDLNCFSIALADQFQSFLNATTEDVENMIPYSYESLIEGNDGHNEILNGAQYTGDKCYVEEKFQKHSVCCYQNFSHTWVIHNWGKVHWSGRKLVVKSTDKNNPTPEDSIIIIPDVDPDGIAKITINFKARSIEGKFVSKWEMLDSDGNLCFMKNDYFNVIIDVSYDKYTEKTNE
jgi:hypothetical protein